MFSGFCGLKKANGTNSRRDVTGVEDDTGSFWKYIKPIYAYGNISVPSEERI